MTNRQKLFLCVDLVVVILLFLVSSTDYVWQEKEVQVSNLSVITEWSQDSTDANFAQGAQKSAQLCHADLRYLNQREYAAQQINLQTLVQREIDNGCQGILLQCGSQQMAQEIVENIPVGTPVVLYGVSVDLPRVKSVLQIDKMQAANKIVEHVLLQRTKGQTITLVLQKNSSDFAKQLHQQLEEQFLQEGVLCSNVVLNEMTETEALAKGLAAQGGNMVVSCDVEVLEAIATVCRKNTLDLPLFGMGWSGDIRKELESGYLYGTLVENAYIGGYLGVQILSGFVTGDNLSEQSYTIETVWVTKETLYDREKEAVLFPFL